MRTLLAAALALALTACVGPTTVLKTVDTRPALAVTGAPGGTTLFLDGNAVGDPRDYDGNPNVLRVEPGTHALELRNGSGAVIFSQRVFLESELKTVVVH
jgi:hypothetical protein